jgi:hypothetical protein
MMVDNRLNAAELVGSSTVDEERSHGSRSDCVEHSPRTGTTRTMQNRNNADDGF